MLSVHTVPLGAYQTNCYILCKDGGQSCVLIDPGDWPEVVQAQLQMLEKAPEAIILTHGHFDHVGGVRQLAQQTGCAVYLCAEDLSMPQQMTAGPLFYTNTVCDGQVLALAGMELRVLHTPGHTPGSVCLLCEDALFSGDTLFAGSCGRTDLPGGSWPVLCQSLKRIGSLERNYTVYPGHGEATTLDTEKKTNPYLKGLL